MLDKSIPYKHIIMKIAPERVAAIEVSALPPGYSYRLYSDGDAPKWARLAHSVREFDSVEDALALFTREFVSHESELRRRCVFIDGPDGRPVATATAWWAESALGRQAILHWVSTDPEHQGKGLGKAVVTKAMSLFPSLEAGKSVYLHTQTWSHVAIRLYHRLGFIMSKTEVLPLAAVPGEERRFNPNEFEEAIAVLRQVYDPDFLRELVENAE